MISSQKFKPKAYYKTFDWEHYTPDESEKTDKKLERTAEKAAAAADKVLNRTKKSKKKREPKLKDYGSFVYSGQKAEKSKAAVSESENSTAGYGKAIKFSIGAKLISIISGLMAVSLILVTVLVSHFISKDTRVNALENNLTMNRRTSLDTENRLNTTISSVGMLMDLLENSSENAKEQKKNAAMFFERNSEIAAVLLPKTKRIFYNNAFFVSHELDSDMLSGIMHSEEDNWKMAENGTTVLANLSAQFETPVIAMFFPVYSAYKDNVIGVIYSAEALSESYSSGSVNQSFLVNSNGSILIHSDIDAMMNGDDISENPIVQEMMKSSVNNSQISFDMDGEEYIGAYSKLNTGDGCVITMAKASVILEAVRATTRRNIYLTFAILSISIMIIYFFGKTLSEPLKRLTAVTDEINKGNFDTDLLNEIPSDRRDEIGVLVKSTRNEQNILNTFTKLTNKGVTKAIIRKEIDFDPHLKDITIFFSDIRGFTAISDGFKNRFGEKSAGEIISFLNDYMSRMVNCIKITNGTVDKFEGDAIMACWGVLRDDSLAYETMSPSSPEYKNLRAIHDEHVKQDALNGIKACIAMRYSLAKYNKEAKAFTEAHKNEPLAKYKPHIRIGAGLNSGRATVGFMGSDDKMEFTSI